MPLTQDKIKDIVRKIWKESHHKTISLRIGEALVYAYELGRFDGHAEEQKKRGIIK